MENRVALNEEKNSIKIPLQVELAEKLGIDPLEFRLINGKQKIDLTTFMVATDPYLVEFVEQFSKEANGKALYTNLDGLGEHILINYENNKRKNAGKK